MNTQPLDYTRFSPPDFRPGQEQRLADAERRRCDQAARIEQVIYKHCKGWTESDFLQLAAEALVQMGVNPDMRNRERDRELWEGFCKVDNAAMRDRERQEDSDG